MLLDVFFLPYQAKVEALPNTLWKPFYGPLYVLSGFRVQEWNMCEVPPGFWEELEIGSNWQNVHVWQQEDFNFFFLF